MLVWVAQEMPSLQDRIGSLIWKNRIVLVYAPSVESDAFQEQMRQFEDQQAEFDDRDLVVIECLPAQLSRADQSYLIRQFQSNPSNFGVWLIGKDGSVKLQSEEPVETKKLFGLIDSMPMRQAEIKRRD